MALELDKVRGIAERVAKDLGLEVADVEFRGGAGKGGRLLRVYIEKAGAAAHGNDPQYCVTHEDCARLSGEMSTILDIEDVVPGSTYLLEVSSPGLDRKLGTAGDFGRFVGSRVKLMTREPVEQNRHWEGRLEAFGAGHLTLDVTPPKKKNKPALAERKLQVELANVEKANLVPEI
ncbi:MAG: ribosome maturation factor RimP [Candidatus Koribacter versatilis]|uniref:Ribosome maturation factor RimP n=1 Tax=Candidatus Korobacter versatilis TaxID=658062 RepID=A0A932A9Q7_9BACT|nr:ribosome maturation factor RimP [Candidatus Koribacter versatilis]